MAFVLSQGSIKSISNPPSLFTDGVIRLHSDHYMTYEAIWRAQPAVRTVIGFLARNIATLGVHLYSGGSSNNDRERVYDHPFTKLMRAPLAGTKLTRYKLLVATLCDIGIYDSAFWLKLRTDEETPPIGVLPIPARMVGLPPNSDNWFTAETYIIRGGLQEVEVPADHIVHFHGYNPADPRTGYSPIETLRGILAEEISAATYRSQLWRNGARFAGYIQRPPAAQVGVWTDEARKRFVESWRAQYAGDTASWLYGGGTPILEDGMSFVPAGVTPQQAQYIESRKLTREEVASAFWLPPSAVGVYDSGTSHNSMESQRESLYRDALPPWCTQFAEDLQTQLLYDVDPSAADGSKYVEFNLMEKLRGGFLDQAKVLTSAVGGPYMTRNEARKMLNLKAVPEGDELVVPKNVTEGGLANPNDTAPDEPDNEESNERVPLRNFIARMGKSVSSKIGAGTPVDWQRWKEELVRDVGSSPGMASTFVDMVEQRVGSTATAVEVRALFEELERDSLV